MKYLLFCACCLLAFPGISGSRVDRIISMAEDLGMTEDNLSELRAACDDYQKAEDRLIELQNLHGLNKAKKRSNPVSADVVDPTIRKIQEQARKYHNRFEVLKKTQKKWGPSTNLLARAARQSMQSRLDETRAERDQAKSEAKALKEMQKAARKFGKNIEKVRKDFKKYRDKAATDDERAFWQSLLEIIPVPNI